MLPPALLVLSSLAVFAPTLVSAGSVQKGGNCSVSDNRLQIGTYQFFTDCDSETFCNPSGVCELRGCRRDDFPFGYPEGSRDVPPKCPRGNFCPDEEDACQPLLAVGSPCQFQRDDECEGPPNWQQLADTSNLGLNSNGSVCLNYQCMWANVTVGQSCIIENTPYIGYSDDGEFIDIVSRGNCKIGLYCDSQALKCMQTKQLDAACSADKECSSFNCLASGKCGLNEEAPRQVKVWVYAVVAIGIFGGMFATLFGFFFVHRRQRDAEREKRVAYWREQNAFRQNIMHMRDTARQSLLSLPSQARTDDSHAPMLGGGGSMGKSSGLRHAQAYSDEGEYTDLDEGLPSDSHAGHRF